MTNNPILIVDDEPLNLAALQQLLCHDYKLVFANGGRDAITAALKHLPALILHDINMPGIDGYSVCRTLKADQRTEAIPVIFVTLFLTNIFQVLDIKYKCDAQERALM